MSLVFCNPPLLKSYRQPKETTRRFPRKLWNSNGANASRSIASMSRRSSARRLVAEPRREIGRRFEQLSLSLGHAYFAGMEFFIVKASAWMPCSNCGQITGRRSGNEDAPAASTHRRCGSAQPPAFLR